MPVARLQIRKRTTYPRFFRWFRLFGKSIEDPVVQVINGRYPARYMEHVGVTSFPVEVELNQAALMIEHFGPLVPDRIFD